MPGRARDPHVEAARRFNRFYTQKIGVLDEGLNDSPFSLAAARVLYELANWPAKDALPTATDLGRRLGLDAGYLSRILRRLESEALIARTTSAADARRTHLKLTARGRTAFARLDAASERDVRALLGHVSGAKRRRIVGAMQTIEHLLGDAPAAAEPVTLRPHRPGDMGMVIHMHGLLYAEEYGFDQTFEALVAEIAARFIRRFDPAVERCWIAEHDGEVVGSVFLVRQSKTVAKLRLLIVDPKARGLGLGRRLVDECIAFARQSGYRKIVLWTNSVLDAARHIYVQTGFELVDSEAHRSFGHDLVGETWELRL